MIYEKLIHSPIGTLVIAGLFGFVFYAHEFNRAASEDTIAVCSCAEQTADKTAGQNPALQL